MKYFTFIGLTIRYRDYKKIGHEPKLKVRKFRFKNKNHYFLELETNRGVLEYSKAYTEKYFNNMVTKFLKTNKIPY